MKILVLFKDGKKNEYESESLPIIHDGFVNIITKGNFLNIESCGYINSDLIEAIGVDK